MNNRNEAADLSYKWHLDDPKAKLPVYSGTGKIRLDGKTSYDVVEQFIPRNDYDQRFYIMNVEIFKDGSRVASYTKQKSPYDWNYTVLPPVRT